MSTPQEKQEIFLDFFKVLLKKKEVRSFSAWVIYSMSDKENGCVAFTLNKDSFPKKDKLDLRVANTTAFRMISQETVQLEEFDLRKYTEHTFDKALVMRFIDITDSPIILENLNWGY